MLPSTQQSCVAQRSPDSVGGTRDTLLHYKFYTDTSADNDNPVMSAKTGAGFAVYEILI